MKADINVRTFMHSNISCNIDNIKVFFTSMTYGTKCGAYNHSLCLSICDKHTSCRQIKTSHKEGKITMTNMIKTCLRNSLNRVVVLLCSHISKAP